MPTPIRSYLVTFVNPAAPYAQGKAHVTVGATSSHVTDESDIPTILAVSRTGSASNAPDYIVLTLVPIDPERQA